MVTGGDIDRFALLESFSRVKEDIARLNSELYEMKLEQKKLLEENLSLKKQLGNGNGHTVDKNMISEIIKETVSSMQKAKKPTDMLMKRINKKRKSIIQSRIYALSESRNHSLPEIKEIIVDNEGLCSKATFYRYIEKMKEKGMIDSLKIQDIEVIARTQ